MKDIKTAPQILNEYKERLRTDLIAYEKWLENSGEYKFINDENVIDYFLDDYLK